MKDPKKTIDLMKDPEKFRQWGALGPKLRKRHRTMTSSDARKTVMVRWDKVRALAADAAGATIVLFMLVVAWFLV
jgi:hypothetical protein